MCRACGDPTHQPSRRQFLKGSALAATSPLLFGGGQAQAQSGPRNNVPGETGRRILLRGGHVMSMDPTVGNFETGDVLIEGRRIVDVGASIDAGDAEVVDATGRVVMPGFIDTHHHQFETALRGWLADGIMYDDGTEAGSPNYLDDILGRFAMAYRPEDVYVSELFGGLSQLDAGVTTVHDVSQIHHSPEHSDAAISALFDAGRRAVFGYFEGYGPQTRYPTDATRIREQFFASDDQLLTMSMGAEIYLEDVDPAELRRIAGDLDLPVAYHVVGSLGMAESMQALAREGVIAENHMLIHMTGMPDDVWRAAADAGAHVSLAVPIEMTMRHGTPPMLKVSEFGMAPSLSVDVECTLTADFFTQMRGAMTMQRAMVNEMALDGVEDRPALLRARDVIEYATVNGAEGLGLSRKVGSLTPGKEADIILLDATALNVAPLNNVPGAVVGLMERTNVESVMVAGEFRKWRGQLVGHDLDALRSRIEASRDYLFDAAGIERDLFPLD
ncbi:amidohydrolase family protein [Roseivivax sp. THAF30]|uniref:amidohydrolase family protein n=1 Tax=Roseivivax sp. THAF30 TaxID=2587852 RepID=UPI00126938B6|nr:amidohydrolase family protein [Roseivivax sp. THAF30]QFT61307.1 Melamine deaminase [Roseivivax sp. THAF30]